MYAERLVFRKERATVAGYIDKQTVDIVLVRVPSITQDGLKFVITSESDGLTHKRIPPFLTDSSILQTMFQQQLSMLDQLAYQQLMSHMVNDVGLRDGASENLGKRFGVIIKGQILQDIFKRPL